MSAENSGDELYPYEQYFSSDASRQAEYTMGCLVPLQAAAEKLRATYGNYYADNEQSLQEIVQAETEVREQFELVVKQMHEFFGEESYLTPIVNFLARDEEDRVEYVNKMLGGAYFTPACAEVIAENIAQALEIAKDGDLDHIAVVGSVYADLLEAMTIGLFDYKNSLAGNNQDTTIIVNKTPQSTTRFLGVICGVSLAFGIQPAFTLYDRELLGEDVEFTHADRTTLFGRLRIGYRALEAMRQTGDGTQALQDYLARVFDRIAPLGSTELSVKWDDSLPADS